MGVRFPPGAQVKQFALWCRKYYNHREVNRCGIGLVVERDLAKVKRRVRFSYPAHSRVTQTNSKKLFYNKVFDVFFETLEIIISLGEKLWITLWILCIKDCPIWCKSPKCPIKSKIKISRETILFPAKMTLSGWHLKHFHRLFAG